MFFILGLLSGFAIMYGIFYYISVKEFKGEE